MRGKRLLDGLADRRAHFLDGAHQRRELAVRCAAVVPAAHNFRAQLVQQLASKVGPEARIDHRLGCDLRLQDSGRERDQKRDNRGHVWRAYDILLVARYDAISGGLENWRPSSNTSAALEARH